MEERLAMLNAAFAAAPYVEEGIAGHYLGDPKDGFHDAAIVKFKDVEAYKSHMRAPHGPDEATYLRENVARIRAFDIITPGEASDTKAKIIELYKERWELFPDVARVLKELEASLPYL
jgi:ubiquinone biosynthesis protein COQ9